MVCFQLYQNAIAYVFLKKKFKLILLKLTVWELWADNYRLQNSTTKERVGFV